jgi:hypothetical protein
MTNIELYTAFLDAKTRVALLQEQVLGLNQQLYAAENNLIVLKEQIETISNDALIQTLLV